jgi:hypothetical protein
MPCTSRIDGVVSMAFTVVAVMAPWRHTQAIGKQKRACSFAGNGVAQVALKDAFAFADTDCQAGPDKYQLGARQCDVGGR